MPTGTSRWGRLRPSLGLAPRFSIPQTVVSTSRCPGGRIGRSGRSRRFGSIRPVPEPAPSADTTWRIGYFALGKAVAEGMRPRPEESGRRKLALAWHLPGAVLGRPARGGWAVRGGQDVAVAGPRAARPAR